ncbi:MAG TPA: hypothetical protein VF097_04590 [Actinomycetota bacterium]
MIPLAFVIAVALATLLVLVVAVVSLVRQMKRVVTSIVEFQEELQPILMEIQGGADRASRRLVELQRDGVAAGSRGRPPRVVPVDPDDPLAPG